MKKSHSRRSCGGRQEGRLIPFNAKKRTPLKFRKGQVNKIRKERKGKHRQSKKKKSTLKRGEIGENVRKKNTQRWVRKWPANEQTAHSPKESCQGI